MTDPDIDAAYVAGTTSVNCNDNSCCHEDTPNLGTSDKAPTYGSYKCNMPMDGFKKMMDTINELNTTSYMSF